ncbi:MAG: 2-C-methyl-D-erythritol 4-phosphate cytidylyltransferase [Chloroflexota bacterium]
MVAAGRGTRMGEDKVWMPLGPMPVVAYSLRAFASCSNVGQVVLVVAKDKLEKGRELVKQMGVPALVCEGGARRQESVQNGLALISGGGTVAIHDGARPLVSSSIIDACYRAAEQNGAAIAAVPVKDTIKQVSPEGWVESTLVRSKLWAVQTPQAFLIDLIRRAYAALDREVTDDAAAVELLGHPVRVVMGSPLNLKLTTREDLAIARSLLNDAQGNS